MTCTLLLNKCLLPPIYNELLIEGMHVLNLGNLHSYLVIPFLASEPNFALDTPYVTGCQIRKLYLTNVSLLRFHFPYIQISSSIIFKWEEPAVPDILKMISTFKRLTTSQSNKLELIFLI